MGTKIFGILEKQSMPTGRRAIEDILMADAQVG
jgi:hypothetical protein